MGVIFEEKRVYFNPDKNQHCLVFYMGGQHGPLRVSKLVCEHYLDWEVGEWTVTEDLTEIPKNWKKVGKVDREVNFYGYAKSK